MNMHHQSDGTLKQKLKVTFNNTDTRSSLQGPG